MKDVFYDMRKDFNDLRVRKIIILSSNYFNLNDICNRANGISRNVRRRDHAFKDPYIVHPAIT